MEKQMMKKSDSKIYQPVPINDESEPKKSDKQSCIRPILGYLLGLLYALSICLMNIFVKMAPSFDASNHSALAYTFQLIVMLIFVKAYDQQILGPKLQRKLLVLRGFAGSATIIFGFFSVRYLDIGDIETLSNSAVIITAVLSRIFLNEKLTFSHVIALILTMTGVLFVVRPSFLFGLEKEMESILHLNLSESNHTLPVDIKDHSNRSFMETCIGVTIVLLSALCFSLTQVAIKKLVVMKAHFSVMTLYPALIGLPASLIISFILIVTKNSKINLNQEYSVLGVQFVYSILSGLFGTACNLLLIYALRYEDATKIAMVKTFGVLFSFILQYLFLGTFVDMLGIIGAAIIIIAILFVLSLKVFDARLSKSKNCLIKILITKF